MIEGSGSVPLTNGSGSRRSKNIWIRIHNPAEKPFANQKSPFSRSEEEIMSDFKLMFSNCRLYNEEGSTIYEVRLKMLLAVFPFAFD
jgi:hypothetical protein